MYGYYSITTDNGVLIYDRPGDPARAPVFSEP